MRNFSICEIIQDLKAILDCLQTCVSNNVNVAIYQAVNPYLCSFVYSGFDYLEKQNIILKISDKSFKKKVGKSRSKFLKQYMEFNQGTFNKLNDFNRNEYVKFFCKKYPNLSPVISKDINNYYIASINDKPIDNYHLSSGILGCEIGSYLDDITPQVQSFIYQMTRFIVQILISAHIEPINNTHKISFPKIKYNDINMAYGYKNFGIQNNPPILMAFLDILCTVNSYNEVFVKINSYKRLDLKVKYLILFGSVIGLKKLMIFCHNSNIELPEHREFEEFIIQTDKSYCKNQLRKYCSHYGYEESDWESDPIVEVFEKNFHNPINEISEDLSMQLLKLSEYLNKFIIKVPLP